MIGVGPHRVYVSELFQPVRIVFQGLRHIVVIVEILKYLGTDNRGSIDSVGIHLVYELFDSSVAFWVWYSGKVRPHGPCVTVRVDNHVENIITYIVGFEQSLRNKKSPQFICVTSVSRLCNISETSRA